MTEFAPQYGLAAERKQLLAEIFGVGANFYYLSRKIEPNRDVSLYKQKGSNGLTSNNHQINMGFSLKTYELSDTPNQLARVFHDVVSPGADLDVTVVIDDEKKFADAHKNFEFGIILRSSPADEDRVQLSIPSNPGRSLSVMYNSPEPSERKNFYTRLVNKPLDSFFVETVAYGGNWFLAKLEERSQNTPNILFMENYRIRKSA